MNTTYEALLNHGLYSQQNTGTALSNSTTLTDVSPGGNVSAQAFQFAGNQLQPGQQYRVRAKGIASNTGTPTLNLGVYLGGVAGTALATTGALATTTGLANALWQLECDLRVVTPGTSGSVYALGSVSGPFANTAMMPATSSSGNLVTGLNTSNVQLLTIGAAWGTASASNSLQVILFTVERLNEGGS